MDRQLSKYIDHTNLKPMAQKMDIEKLCTEAARWQFASVCVNPYNVPLAKALLKGTDVNVCTVIGFPLGANTTKIKVMEAREAYENGCDEFDMVINIGWLKDQKYDLIENEIRTLKAACGDKILKVIIETCFLTDEEKIKMCQIVTEAGADYIKTSTGFGGAGATFADIELFSRHIGPNVKMKAAGGISSLEDAEKFLALGADRLGTSRIIKIVKNEKATGY